MISVVIPTYKKIDMLLANLAKNSHYLRDSEIIIVNDDPTQSIRRHIDIKRIQLIEHQRNLGFSGAVNSGFAKAQGKYVLLINSDVVLTDYSWQKAVEQLDNDNSIFAVSFAQKERTGEIVGKNEYEWRHGFFTHHKAADLTAGLNAWAEGGACMIRRAYFEYLRGFDDIYAPFYWEDIDLSYRAYRAGYKILFNPDIVVLHNHESTIGTYFPDRIQAVAMRNQFIFIWKNISDPWLLITQIVFVPYFLIRNITQPVILRSYLAALARLPAIIQRRIKQKTLYTRSDREIIAQFNHKHT